MKNKQDYLDAIEEGMVLALEIADEHLLTRVNQETQKIEFNWSIVKEELRLILKKMAEESS